MSAQPALAPTEVKRLLGVAPRLSVAGDQAPAWLRSRRAHPSNGMGSDDVAPREACLRVLVLQPNRLVCQSMVRAIDHEEDLVVVAHTDRADEAGQLAEAHHPDVVVLDDAVEHVGDVVAAIKQASVAARVLVVGHTVEPERVERSLVAGADGFTLTTLHFDEFADAIRGIGAGRTILHPDVASTLVQAVAAFTKGERRTGPMLTDRQLDILRLVADGLPNKVIARTLGIGVETVKTHVSRILERLEASSRTEAVVVAVREGLLDRGARSAT